MSVRSWWPWLAAAALVLVLATAGQELAAVLRYERGAILSGELWRLLTAHWLHLGINHALMNAAALLLLRTALGGGGPRRDIPALLGCQAGVGMGLLVFSGGVDWYVGLSGALHGYAIYLAAYSGGRAVFGLVTAVVAAKVGWESWQGASAALEAMVGGRVLVIAHLYGAVTGLTLALIVRLRARPPAAAKA